MPINQRIEPPPALVVLSAGGCGPSGDVGISGNSAGIRSTSAAGGRGQTGDMETWGAVEHAQSRLAQTHAAVSRAGNRIIQSSLELSCRAQRGVEIGGQRVATLLGLGVPLLARYSRCSPRSRGISLDARNTRVVIDAGHPPAAGRAELCGELCGDDGSGYCAHKLCPLPAAP
jgi:hypothetical protein